MNAQNHEWQVFPSYVIKIVAPIMLVAALFNIGVRFDVLEVGNVSQITGLCTMINGIGLALLLFSKPVKRKEKKQLTQAT